MPVKLIGVALATMAAFAHVAFGPVALAQEAAAAAQIDLRRAAEILADEHVDAPDEGAFNLTSIEAFEASVRRVLGESDPYTRLIPPAERLALRTRDARQVVGVGALLVDLGGDGVLLAPHVSSALYDQAGIADVFALESIDAAPPRDFDDARTRLGGEVGEPIALRLAEVGAGDARTVTLTRRLHDYPYLDAIAFDAGGGERLDIIRLNTFVEGDTTRALELAIRASRRAGRPLVIDLRFNRGGELIEAIEAANAFVPDGAPIAARVRRRDPAPFWHRGLNRAKLAAPKDIVLLIGPDTASAAEVFARALAAAGATTAGRASFGKCTGQDVFDLGAGWALMATTTRILDPQGARCDGQGLAPDVAAPGGGPAAVYDTRALLSAAFGVLGATPVSEPAPRSAAPPSASPAAFSGALVGEAASAAPPGWYACRATPPSSEAEARVLARLIDIGFGQPGVTAGVVIDRLPCLGPFAGQDAAAAMAGRIDLEPDAAYAARRWGD